MYFLVTLAIVVSVSWQNPYLPPIFGNTVQGRDLSGYNKTSGLAPNRTTSPTILAIGGLNSDLAGFVNACLVFSVLSAGNSSIYYSSRTLWGLTYNLQGQNHVSRWFKRLSPLMASSGAPIRTIFFTFGIFFWIPYLQLVPSTERVRFVKCSQFRYEYSFSPQVLQVMSLSSSISCLIVWLALMVSFLRYKEWSVIRITYPVFTIQRCSLNTLTQPCIGRLAVPINLRKQDTANTSGTRQATENSPKTTSCCCNPE
jgi:yeast amino acid transporter